MNSTKIDNLKIKVIKLTLWFLYAVILLGVTELLAGFALKIYRNTQRGATQRSFLTNELKEHLTNVQSNVHLNLYRWYSNVPNYNSSEVQTDASGFRINTEKLSSKKLIGMFGGSTTFSVLTNQEQSIPDLMTNESSSCQILNFGVGGY